MIYDDYLDEEDYEWVVDYTLEIGDSLEDIADAYETSVEEIAELNSELSAEQYVPGRRIRVPYPRRRRRYPWARYPYRHPRRRRPRRHPYPYRSY
jgi:hypothetical protein